jgi:hypothetical protein
MLSILEFANWQLMGWVHIEEMLCLALTVFFKNWLPIFENGTFHIFKKVLPFLLKMEISSNLVLSFQMATVTWN